MPPQRRSARVSFHLIAIFKLTIALLATASTMASAARADYLLGVRDSGRSLIQIDPTTGQGTIIGTTGALDSPEDIQTDGQGRLIAVGFLPGINTSFNLKTTIAQIDPVTGVATVLATATEYRFIEGLANVNGVIYGSASAADSYGPDTSNHLVRIDLAAGTFTEVGKFGNAFLNVEDLAYSPKYGLIGVDIGTLDPATNYQTYHTTPALVHIDIATGQATKIADLPFTNQLVGNPANSILSPYGPYLCGLDFAPDGTLYASTWPTHFGGASFLVKVDPTSGAITQVGPIGSDQVDGLVYISTVPEPASLGMLLVGGSALAGLLARRRNREAS